VRKLHQQYFGFIIQLLVSISTKPIHRTPTNANKFYPLNSNLSSAPIGDTSPQGDGSAQMFFL
jgi:hypothetical protein